MYYKKVPNSWRIKKLAWYNAYDYCCKFDKWELLAKGHPIKAHMGNEHETTRSQFATQTEECLSTLGVIQEITKPRRKKHLKYKLMVV